MPRCAAALLTLLAVSLPAAVPLPAHAGGFSTYVTSVTGIEPTIAGVTITAPANGEDINVSNTGPTPLIVEGYEHDQYLKITAHGVWQNKLSPAVYLNKEQTVGNLPDDANATRPPQWVKIGEGHHAQWHDHRIHWMGVTNPPVVQHDPQHAHLVNTWRIPVISGSTRAAIVGTLTYEPGSHLGSYLTYGAIGLAVIVVIGLQILILRRRRQPAG